jgi:hypothetical protein
MRPDAAMNRLHKTLSQLRRAGLAGVLRRDGERYHLDDAVPRWPLPPPGRWSGDTLRTLIVALQDPSHRPSVDLGVTRSPSPEPR